MLPSLVAEDLRRSLTHFLGTTFALADDDVRTELEQFIADPDHGVFRGPYVRLKLPFRPADDRWRAHLDWAPSGFLPHKHQAAAWTRLASRDRLPEPTLVTTGTGSGKTESFLIPLLEHCRRERGRGHDGIKAIVLYPMNALANDQARRIAALVHAQRAELGDVTVGLYTGDSGNGVTMTATEVVESKFEMRRRPPDILLTNYKMLDMLLLRQEDVPLWEHAAESLRYLVLDEFHTYDGAQGTDVAMLLRRLGMALGIMTDDRPLGAVTPVATSATLGSGEEDRIKLRTFAETVFGAPFGDDALIGEDRLAPDEWLTPSRPITLAGRTRTPVVPLLPQIAELIPAPGEAPLPHHRLLRHAVDLFFPASGRGRDDEVDPAELGAALRTHPFTRTLLELASAPRNLAELADLAEPVWSGTTRSGTDTTRHAVALYLALLSWARDPSGSSRPLLTIDVQLWIREVTRLVRRLSASPRFRWFEGSASDDGDRLLPSVFCRHCGRSGWGVTVRAGGGLDLAPATVWRRSVSEPAATRAWLYAPGEAAEDAPGVQWADPATGELSTSRTGRHSPEVPVLASSDVEAKDETCPSCGQKDAIRFLGSRVATLASATLGQVFGSTDIRTAEKKTLVFTDSVQDASHRAAFVENRAYALNLRALIHRAIGDDGCTLDRIGPAIETAGTDRGERFAVLPPELRDHEIFTRYWSQDDPDREVREAVALRMGFSATLEFGLSSRTGRTMELTGAATAHVEVGDLGTIARSALDAVAQTATQLQLEDVGDRDLLPPGAPGPTEIAWVRGILERVRAQGGIAHPWLVSYAELDDRYPIWGHRNRRSVGMPAFPRGRPAPAFPTSAKHTENLGLIGPRSWYAQWTARILQVPTVDAPRYVRALFDALVADGALTTLEGTGGSTVWQIPPGRVRIARTRSNPLRLRCTVCSTIFPGPEPVLRELTGAPCHRDRCTGVYRAEQSEYDYYRDLYRGEEVRRIIAREHTSLLPTKERVGLETDFKSSAAPDSPNVLTCTPTLELGIDIGDLSMVALTSLPRSTASYLQRVGRAGRLTGNALVLSLLPARPLELQRLAQPLSMIAGDVVPPACYLDATEILRRQYLASLVDRRARSGSGEPTRLADEVFRDGLTPASWLGSLVADAREHAALYVDEFLRGFGQNLVKESAQALREWAGDGGPEGEPPGLERAVENAVQEWNAESEELAERITALQAASAELEEHTKLDDAGEREKRRLRGELIAAYKSRSARGRTYWISALEARGLLPNYSLLDDSTTLDVGLWWFDEENGAGSDESSYVRGSRTALHELAPGATFYVRGAAVDIDAVDVGTSRNPATERRRFCPACGWSVRIGPTTAAGPCARCGAAGAADSGQVLTTLPFRKASAYSSRERAQRDEDREERRKTRFGILTTVDVDPEDVTSAWRLADYPFGAEVLRAADIRWINTGPADRGGATMYVAGNEISAPLFLTCRHCGVVPAAQRTDTEGVRHRGWCRQRKEPDPDGWLSIALTHELRTQAVRILVPPIVEADATVHTSLRAAILLGLRAVLGGDPDHLDVTEATDPTADGGSRSMMVLHDLVPGGTGYLARFTEAADVHRLLAEALAVLENCRCRDEGTAACHRCLLPYVAPYDAEFARRDTAIDLIREVFAHWDPEPIDSLRDLVVGPQDTPIEKRFRELFLNWAKQRGAAVTKFATAQGDRAEIRFPKVHGNRQWSLTPQVKLGGVRPDFLLTTADNAVPDIAIFCDGARYHCSAEHNRVADDAGKRAGLRDAGKLVWSITHQDLETFSNLLTGAPEQPVHWLSPQLRKQAEHLGTKLAVVGAKKTAEILRDPSSLLTAFVLDPDLDAWGPAAHSVALALTTVAPLQKIVEQSIPALLEAEATGARPTGDPGPVPVAVGRTPGGLAIAAERRSPKDARVRLCLDDRTRTVGSDDQVAAWRDFLAVSAVLQFLEPGRLTAATVSTLPSMLVPVGEAVVVPPPWQEIAETYEGTERDRVLGLATAGLPVPESGFEVDDGRHMIDLAWPAEAVAVLFEPDDDVLEYLNDHGWTVVPPDEKAVRAAVTNGGGS
ncbi:DEAD/DEAH box helicase [Pseudonocardia phyllosphaerae]|uniref:DEAD/DEAH box helicase n=1 Tax=Pseudonocardia phyllosphaerae TaxID=3390502 RepID=UPI0039790B6F